MNIYSHFTGQILLFNNFVMKTFHIDMSIDHNIYRSKYISKKCLNFISMQHTISIKFLIRITLSYLVKKEWICRAMHYVISQISINFIFGLFPIIAVRMLIQIDLTWLSCRTNGFSYQLTIFSLIASLYGFRVFLCLISFISRCP